LILHEPDSANADREAQHWDVDCPGLLIRIAAGPDSVSIGGDLVQVSFGKNAQRRFVHDLTLLRRLLPAIVAFD